MRSITKNLNQIASEGYNIGQVFRDWVSLMLFSLAKEEDMYLEIMGRYRNEGKENREADLFAKAFGQLQIEMGKENHDILGDIYMEIVSNWSAKGMGQFFTPVNLCEMMADMTIKDDSKPVSVADPACGSGRTLISAAKRTHADSEFHAVDADNVCAQMCALNMCFFNMNGFVIHGNTLSMKYYDGWITKRSIFGGSVRRMSDKEVKAYHDAYGNMLKNEEGKEQLSLF